MAGQKRIGVLLHDLRGGGAERVSLKLVRGFLASGYLVDLILVRAQGDYLDEIPHGARVIDLKKTNVFKSVFAIARYLRRERPSVVMASLPHINIALILAAALARTRTRIALTEHNQISAKAARDRSIRGGLVYRLAPWLYPRADVIISVSEGVARDLEVFLRLPSGRVTTIYNPVYDDTIPAAALAAVDHPWLQADQLPVIVSAGRLNPQKGFDILLQAFEVARRRVDCRLLVMGEGEERQRLEQQALDLGVAEFVDFVGFVANPYAVMARAAVFVVSSRYEGFSLAVVEALACGTPVVATDCPSGPSEVLENGRFGELVQVDDVDAMAEAIIRTIETGKRNTGLERARRFSVEAAVERYLEVLAP